MSRMAAEVALITSAGARMGRTQAVQLAQEGADIIALDLVEDALAETAAALGWAEGRGIVTTVADVRDLEEITDG